MKTVVIEDGHIGWLANANPWTNFYWLEKNGASYAEGNLTNTYGLTTSLQMKELVSNEGLPSTEWATDSNINNGYPYLKAFDDTSIWLRDSSINDGEPYLKNNPPNKI